MTTRNFHRRMAARAVPPRPVGAWRGPVFTALALELAFLASFALAVLHHRVLPAVALALLAAIVALPLAYFVRGRLLIRRLRETRALVVLSDSPRWKGHIEDRWLPRLGASVRVLDWSQRQRWLETPEGRVWRHFAGPRDFNPLVILLPPGGPRIFRFYAAFQLAGRGDANPLEMLERQMLEELAAIR